MFGIRVSNTPVPFSSVRERNQRERNCVELLVFTAQPQKFFCEKFVDGRWNLWCFYFACLLWLVQAVVIALCDGLTLRDKFAII